jgi:iron complex outermembrane recepter protein
LNSQLGSVNVNDDLADPFQPDILYRGFEASPVLGTPQGLAVYQNGVRINEATSVSQGFFQNIGDTRRQGVEAGLNYTSEAWSAFVNYSYVDATFQSPLTVPSPPSPFQDVNGDIQVHSGDHLPGIPQHRLKMGADYKILPNWTLGATLNLVSDFYYVGDESNQLAPIAGYHVVGLHTSFKVAKQFEAFASISNLLNAKYATWGILSDPTGIGGPGIPANGITNGPGVDNRFLSPAAPFEAFAGVRLNF